MFVSPSACICRTDHRSLQILTSDIKLSIPFQDPLIDIEQLCLAVKTSNCICVLLSNQVREWIDVQATYYCILHT